MLIRDRSFYGLSETNLHRETLLEEHNCRIAALFDEFLSEMQFTTLIEELAGMHEK